MKPENKHKQTEQIKKKENNLPDIPHYIKTEVFLENTGFFTPSSKRIKSIYTKEKKIEVKIDSENTRQCIKTKISANYELGLPITSDLDYYRAFLRVCDEIVDKAGRFNLPIAVPTSRLIHYAGKSEGAREWKEVKRWFDRMTLTGISGAMFRKKEGDYFNGFTGSVFSQVVYRGDKKRNGDIAETNYVWLSPWFLSNYFYRHIRSIDYNFHRRLRKPIAKSLYPLLETGWYASGGELYKKSYCDLCDEFLLTKHKKFSYIKQQLDPSHKELVKESYLAKWEYTKSKTKPDYIITYYPGDKFFLDQKARKERQQTAEQINNKSPLCFPPNQLKSKTGPLSEKPSYKIDGLVEDILAVCKDDHSKNFYKKVAHLFPETLIYRMISEVKEVRDCMEIKKSKGAIFTSLAQKYARKHGIDL